MAKKLLNPRGYISWTQVSMWRNSKDRYIRRYILGKDEDIRNSGIDYGKKAADAFESGEETDDEMLNMVSKILPRYEIMEHEIRVPLLTPNGSVDLLGKLDTFSPKTLQFRERKTGRIKWTQSKAERHFQLHHYQTMIWLKHGKFDPATHLDWAETEEVDGAVRLTGNVSTFEVTIGMPEILEYISLLSRVASEIDAVYRQELKKLG